MNGSKPRATKSCTATNPRSIERSASAVSNTTQNLRHRLAVPPLKVAVTWLCSRINGQVPVNGHKRGGRKTRFWAYRLQSGNWNPVPRSTSDVCITNEKMGILALSFSPEVSVAAGG